MKKNIYRTNKIVVPKYVFTLHRLADFLVDDYVYKKKGDFTSTDKFNFLVDTAIEQKILILEVPKVTAKVIKENYRVALSRRNSRQLEFIIEKILETSLKA